MILYFAGGWLWICREARMYPSSLIVKEDLHLLEEYLVHLKNLFRLSLYMNLYPSYIITGFPLKALKNVTENWTEKLVKITSV